MAFAFRLFARSPTIRQLADDFFAERERTIVPNWARESRRFMERDVLPDLGALRANRVTRREISAALERIAARGSPRIADLALAQTRALFNWAVASGRLDEAAPNPTRGLRKLGTARPRERVLSDEELRAVWHVRASPQVRGALRLQLLTACRVSEAIGAARCEFDLAGALWTLPAERTKSRRAHRVPMSAFAVQVVAGAAEGAGASRWLFPAEGGARPVHAKSAQRVMLRLRLGVASHDLRRTAATRLGEMGVADEVIERVLNHAPVGVTRQSYNHARRLGEMRAALEAWGAVLGRIVGAG